MSTNTLRLPALRGVIGDWIFYVSVVPFSQIVNRVKTADEIHKSDFLRDLLQRSLENRTAEIARYLKNHAQRFFSAVVIGLYGGDPEWSYVSVNAILTGETAFDSTFEKTVGVLSLRGDEKLFAIDGQHRIEGIKKYLKDVESDCQDELCCIFVSHKTDVDGMQRTRKLFSTLNRYAKPVSLTDIISLNEDDIVAIVCRELLETHPLFKEKGRVSLQKGKSIGRSDSKAVVSLVALYQFVDIFLSHGSKASWEQYKAKRPLDSDVADAKSRLMFFLNNLIEHIEELKNIAEAGPTSSIPERLRGSHGGDILFRPVFFPIIAKCLKMACAWGMSEEDFVSRFSLVPRELSNPPWNDVLWNGNMQVRKENQVLARDLILWMINADPSETHVTQSQLRDRYARIAKIDIQSVKLPPKLISK